MRPTGEGVRSNPTGPELQRGRYSEGLSTLGGLERTAGNRYVKRYIGSFLTITYTHEYVTGDG